MRAVPSGSDVKVSTSSHAQTATQQELAGATAAQTPDEVPIHRCCTCTQAAPQSKQEPNDVTFDVRGIDPAIANALRRILIAEVRRVWCLALSRGGQPLDHSL